jgi:hypothetical protein
MKMAFELMLLSHDLTIKSMLEYHKENNDLDLFLREHVPNLLKGLHYYKFRLEIILKSLTISYTELYPEEPENTDNSLLNQESLSSN